MDEGSFEDSAAGLLTAATRKPRRPMRGFPFFKARSTCIRTKSYRPPPQSAPTNAEGCVQAKHGLDRLMQTIRADQTA
jgi:hypothetical protein